MRRRNAGLIRALTIARRIEGMRYLLDLAPLAAEFQVCTRTIHRDLCALEEAGWPVPEHRYYPRKARCPDLTPADAIIPSREART